VTQDATVWRRSTEVAHVESPGRVAMIDLTHLDRPPVILEGTGAAIWAHLESPVGENELIAALAAEYDADPAEVGPSVLDFLAQLDELGLVERS
jgi:Coenzyme PQQ synthesis protein D (PqqD)